MWKMLIADDEPVILAGIQKLVDWKRLGIEIIGTAKDGREAFSYLLSEKPDIALLDISMPEKTGLQILKEIREIGIPTKVVFISGYQEFEYAMEAINLGAAHYLLKPVNREALVNAICQSLDIQREKPQARASAESEKEVLYSQLLKLAAEEYLPVGIHIFSPEEEQSIGWKLTSFAVYNTLKEYLEERGEGAAFSIEGGIYCVFTRGLEADFLLRLKMMAAYVRERNGCQLGFMPGQIINEIGDVFREIRMLANQSNQYYFAKHQDGFALIPAGPVDTTRYSHEELVECRLKMIDGVIEQNIHKVKTGFYQYGEMIRRNAWGDKEMAVFYIASIIREVEVRMEKIHIFAEKINRETVLEEAMKCISFDGMCAVVFQYINDLMTDMKSSIYNKDKRDIVKARHFIETYYMDNLSLETLANHVFMSPAYFSSFFKKETGKNFKEYLNEVRLKHALELMIATDKKVYEIAELAGFSDVRYFIEQFKKEYKKTPKQYLKTIKKS